MLDIAGEKMNVFSKSEEAYVYQFEFSRKQILRQNLIVKGFFGENVCVLVIHWCATN